MRSSQGPGPSGMAKALVVVSRATALSMTRAAPVRARPRVEGRGEDSRGAGFPLGGGRGVIGAVESGGVLGGLGGDGGGRVQGRGGGRGGGDFGLKAEISPGGSGDGGEGARSGRGDRGGLGNGR